MGNEVNGQNGNDYWPGISNTSRTIYFAEPNTSTPTHNSFETVYGGGGFVGTGASSDAVNGTWTLYIADEVPGDCTPTCSSASFTGWTLSITYTPPSNADNTSTSLTPSSNPVFVGGNLTLTATVKDTTNTGTTVNGGTVTFTDNSTNQNVACTSGNQTVSGGTATCGFSVGNSEGTHTYTATYNGSSGVYNPSNSDNSPISVAFANHTSQTGNQYCNNGTITSSDANTSGSTSPLPSYIFIGNPDTTTAPSGGGVIDAVTVKLNSLNTASGDSQETQALLLVGPGGQLIVFNAYSGDNNNSGTNVSNLTFSDSASSQAPSLEQNANGPDSPLVSNTSYKPSSYFDQTGEGVPVEQAAFPTGTPAFAVSNNAAPTGTATFGNTFAGAAATGTWSLYYSNWENGSATVGGWCLDFTMGGGDATSTSVSSTEPTALTSDKFNIAATVNDSSNSGTTVNAGTVTFTAGNLTLGSAPVSNGTATLSNFMPSSVPGFTEGTYDIVATYSGSGDTFGPSHGQIAQRINNPGPAPTISGSTYTYCSSTPVVIPYTGISGAIATGAPYPSNIIVSNLPGTLNSLKVQLNAENDFQDIQNMAFLLTGSAGGNIDFFSNVGGFGETMISNTLYTIFDGAASRFGQFSISDNPPAGNYLPESYNVIGGGADTFPLCQGLVTDCNSSTPVGPPAPTSYNYAPPTGSATFSSVFSSGNTYNGNGTWSLYAYADVSDHPSGTLSSWCVELDENLPSLSITKSGSNSLTQGQTGAQYTLTVTNNGPGPTGGTVTVTDTPSSGLTVTGMSGTGWTCSVPTCTSNASVGAGDNYPAITVTVSVAANATASQSNSATAYGGGSTQTSALPAMSNTVLITVVAETTTVASNAAASYRASSQNVTLTAVVTSGAGTVNGGTVTFTVKNGNVQVGNAVSGTVTNGLASAFYSLPGGTAPGPYSIEAVYSGTTGFAASTDTSHTLTVTAGPPASITANAGTTPQSAAVNTAFGTALAVTVTDALSNPITSASVTFTVNPGPEGASGSFNGSATVVTSNGVATAPQLTANAIAGKFTVTATVNSLSTTFVLTNGTSSSIVLNTPSSTSRVLSQPVTLTANVTPSTATGNVTFYDGSNVLGYVPLSSGTATLTTPFLPAGGNSLKALYDGLAPNAPSSISSPAQTVTVTPYASPALGAPVQYNTSGEQNQGTVVEVADVNGDGIPDLLVLQYGTGTLNVLLGKGDGTFPTSVPAASFLGTCAAAGGAVTCQLDVSNPLQMVVGDFNGDGKPDVAFTTQDSNTIGILLGNGDGTFQSGGSVSPSSQLAAIAAADFNGDGITDLVITAGSGSVSVLLGKGDGTFPVSYGPYMVGSNPSGVVVGDFNNDGVPDVATANGGGTVTVLLGNGDGTLTAAMGSPYTLSGAPASIVAGHFSTSGNLDLAVATNQGNNVSVLLGNGNGTFQNPVTYSTDSLANPSPVSLATGDVNGDGKTDLVVANLRSNDVAVLIGNGNGTFQATAVTYPLSMGLNPVAVAVGDFNLDGRTDVVAANSGAANLSVLLGTIPGETLAITGGGTQSTVLATPFSQSLQVTVTDSNMNPVPNLAVTFTAPSTGASGAFSNSSNTITAKTNASGQVSESFTANTTAGGPYNVTATAGTLSASPSFSLTNQPTPVLSVSKTAIGTFTQGQSAEWDITITNTVTGSTTNGTTYVSDSLPSGYTLSSFSGHSWTCFGSTAISCISSQTVSGGGTFDTLQLFVNVPATSPTSVTNTASAYGGGDLTHPNGTNAATGSVNTTVVQVPASITINGNATQSATVGVAFGSLAVTVKDAGGVVIPNYASVVFTATTGANGQSGTFSNSTNTITISANSSGVANPGTLTANTKAGSYTVGVTAGTATNTFNLTNNAGLPNSIATSGGGTQSATINMQFGTMLAVLVKDSYGNPVQGATVTFVATPASNGASATLPNSGIATTDPTGTASITPTANSKAGQYTVTASANMGALTGASFTLTNLAGTAANIAVSSGSGQSATVNTAFGNPLVALVTDSGSNPVSGVTVTFAAPVSGASGTFAVNGSTAVTNTNGLATSGVFTANTKAGAYTVSANFSGNMNPAASFSLTNNPGLPASLALTQGSGQSAQINKQFTNALTATVTDAYTNPVPGVTVTFTPPAQTLPSITFASNVNTAMTNVNGVATSNAITANSHAGPQYSVAAMASTGSASNSFLLTNLPGPPASIALTGGNNQSAIVNTGFSNALTVTVTDAGNNPVPSAIVTFTPPAQTSASITFASNVNTAMTNVNGVATSAAITANGINGGPYHVAVTSGTASNNFSLTNLPPTVPITVETSPAGASYTVNGTTYTSTQTLPELIGSNVTIAPGSNSPLYVFTGFTVNNSPVSGSSYMFQAQATTTVILNFTGGTTSLGGSLGTKSGPQNARVWSFTIGNNGPGEAVGAAVTGLSFVQTSGAACTPVISGLPAMTTPANIAPQATGTASVTINFTGCASTAMFKATFTLSANNGGATATVVKTSQLQ